MILSKNIYRSYSFQIAIIIFRNLHLNKILAILLKDNFKLKKIVSNRY